MTRSATLTLAALALAALLLPCRAVSQSSDECEEWSTPTPLDEEVPLCGVVKSDADAGRFTIHELPDSSATFELRSGEGFLLHQECRSHGAGLQCSGWPQEAKARGNLRYQWSFEQRDQRTDHPEPPHLPRLRTDPACTSTPSAPISTTRCTWCWTAPCPSSATA
jgi:hypothetical protein